MTRHEYLRHYLRHFAAWWALDTLGYRPQRPPGQRWERTAAYTAALKESP